MKIIAYYVADMEYIERHRQTMNHVRTFDLYVPYFWKFRIILMISRSLVNTTHTGMGSRRQLIIAQQYTQDNMAILPIGSWPMSLEHIIDAITAVIPNTHNMTIHSYTHVYEVETAGGRYVLAIASYDNYSNVYFQIYKYDPDFIRTLSMSYNLHRGLDLVYSHKLF